jgi:ribosomal protein S18 acetylase RimI-like enzyme
MADSETQLRNLKIEDCLEVAILHKKAFPQSSLTKLGIEAVRRYYVKQMEGLNECLALGAFKNQRLIGYIFAGVFHGGLTSFIIENRWFLIGRVLTHPWLFVSPVFREAIKLGLKKLRKGRQVSVQIKTSNNNKSPFVILAIAVEPKLQKKGVGGLLMISAEEYAIEQGFQKMLLTVNAANDKAIRFYKENGWQRTQKNYQTDLEMVKQLSGMGSEN